MKVNEIILEASYDGMVTNLKQQYTDQDIVGHVKWAKAILKKDERIVWYLRILKAVLSSNKGELSTLLGGYNFTSIEQLQTDVGHFFGYDSSAIQNYTFGKKTVQVVISELSKLEGEYKDSLEQSAPVKLKSGDNEIISFQDGTSWWYLNRSYCPEEGQVVSIVVI